MKYQNLQILRHIRFVETEFSALRRRAAAAATAAARDCRQGWVHRPPLREGRGRRPAVIRGIRRRKPTTPVQRGAAKLSRQLRGREPVLLWHQARAGVRRRARLDVPGRRGPTRSAARSDTAAAT